MCSIVNASSDNSYLVVVRFYDETRGDSSKAPRHDVQIAMEHGMMIAKVNMAIGAIELKMIKDGKSNNRETDKCPCGTKPLTSAPVEGRSQRHSTLNALHGEVLVRADLIYQ